MDQPEPGNEITYSQFIAQCTALTNYGFDLGLLGQMDVIRIINISETIERPKRLMDIGEWKVWLRNVLLEYRQRVLIQFDYLLKDCQL